MTNPYKAILTHDPARTSVCATPDMLQSFQPLMDSPSASDQGIGIHKVQVRSMFIKWAFSPLCLTGLVAQFIHSPPEYLVGVVWISV